MTFLILGIVVWSVAHLLPAIARGPRQRWIEKIGEPRYKLAFTLTIALSLALIIGGWKSAEYVSLYPVAMSTRWLALALMLVSIILFAVSATRNNFKRWLRHPQMLSVILWSIAHLLSNGDAASLVLFGGLALWAAIEIVAINRRDGEWQKPARQPRKNDVIAVLAGLLGFVTALLLHPWLSGVSLVQLSGGGS
jgi:uncharacterized membrane protein